MTPHDALSLARDGNDLTAADMEAVMNAIMDGTVDPALLKDLLIAWRDKGEAVSEIVGAARAMRAHSVRIEISSDKVLDTCGTGGDGKDFFNVSTAVALVAAAAGATVAKHGNRAVSSKSGSADVLREAGVNLEIAPDAVAACIEEIGIGFLFAPGHHPAMRHAAPVRAEIGTRTIFNLLGPLTNPAGAGHQLIGLFDAQWLVPYAETLKELGTERAMVVHARDGLDELSLNAPTDYAMLEDGTISTGSLEPELAGLGAVDERALRADSPAQSLAMIHAAFAGEDGPVADLICYNAAAALHVAGLAENFAQGAATARAMLTNGDAAAKLEQLVATTRRLGEAT